MTVNYDAWKTTPPPEPPPVEPPVKHKTPKVLVPYIYASNGVVYCNGCGLLMPKDDLCTDSAEALEYWEHMHPSHANLVYPDLFCATCYDDEVARVSADQRDLDPRV